MCCGGAWVCVTGAGGSVGVDALCGEANEKPDMAAVIGVVEPCFFAFLLFEPWFLGWVWGL
jgi:hypothetical protein